MPFSLVIPALIRPLTIEALVTWFPGAARAMDQIEANHASLQGEILRANPPAPGNVRQAAAEGKTAQVEARSKLEFIRDRLRTAAGYARRVGVVSDAQIREAGLGAVVVAIPAFVWVIGILGGGAALLAAAAAFYSAYSTAAARQQIMAAWSDQVRAQQATNPGGPLPPIPNVPAGPPGWLESNINAAGNAVAKSTAPLLMLGLFAAFYLFSKESKKRKEATAT